MKKTMTKIFALVLVLAMVIGFVAMIPAQAASNVEIYANNVGFAEKLHMMYAIEAESIASYSNVVINLYDEDGNSLGKATRTGEQTIDDVVYAVFTAQKGIAVQDIAENVYAKVMADGNEVASGRRSVLEYLYSQLLTNTKITANQKAMYESLLAYAGALQTVLDDAESKDINNYSFVKVENGTIDGTYAAGMIEAGTTLSGLTSDLVAGEGQKIVWTVTKSGAANGTLKMTTEEVQAITVEKGVNLILTVEVEEDNSDLPTKKVTFTMGEDAGPGHSESSSAKTTYTETVDGYTLNLTNGDRMYPGANDEVGNGAIKLGASSAAGKFTLTVADDVSKVILYVAGYKANVAKVSVNGTAQTINTLSNNGEYTAIEIDTSSNKTIEFTTASGGWRAMLNTIEFVVPDNGQTEPTEPEATEPSVEPTEPSVEPTEPSVEPSEPEATEPSVEPSEPEVTEPEVTEPEVTEPEVTEPEVVEPKTVTMDIFASKGTMNGTASISWTSDGVTFTNRKASSTTAIRTSDSDHFRVYANSALDISANGKITKIVITCTSTTYATAMANSIGSAATASGSVVTVTLDGSSSSLELAAKMTAQTRLNKIEVTYIPE